MDGLITVDELREIFDIDPQIKDPRFTRALKAAGRRMREWVGADAYDDALSNAPENATRAEDLEYAEAHLVMHFAVLGINTALRREGIVSSESVEGNKTLSYLRPSEIATLQEQYLETAESIARPYLSAQANPTPSFVAAEE